MSCGPEPASPRFDARPRLPPAPRRAETFWLLFPRAFFTLDDVSETVKAFAAAAASAFALARASCNDKGMSGLMKSEVSAALDWAWSATAVSLDAFER